MDLAYSLALIEMAELSNLRTIGEIRNSFAHSDTEGRFGDQSIAALCNRLDYAYEVFIVRGHAERDPDKVRSDLDALYKVQRNRFTHTCVTLGQTLIGAAARYSETGHHRALVTRKCNTPLFGKTLAPRQALLRNHQSSEFSPTPRGNVVWISRSALRITSK